MRATKVTRFPYLDGGRTYPFREIAEDGGVWKLDSAHYAVGIGSMRRAAHDWAGRNNYRADCRADGTALFVQFSKRAATP